MACISSDIYYQRINGVKKYDVAFFNINKQRSKVNTLEMKQFGGGTEVRSLIIDNNAETKYTWQNEGQSQASQSRATINKKRLTSKIKIKQWHRHLDIDNNKMAQRKVIYIRGLQILVFNLELQTNLILVVIGEKYGRYRLSTDSAFTWDRRGEGRVCGCFLKGVFRTLAICGTSLNIRGVVHLSFSSSLFFTLFAFLRETDSHSSVTKIANHSRTIGDYK